MSSNNSLVPVMAVLLIVSGAATGWSGYSYMAANKQDQFYSAHAAELQVSALQAVYIAERAAIDSSYTSELTSLESEVDASLSLLRSGEPLNGIPGAPNSVANAINNFESVWSEVTPKIGKIAGSKASTEIFTRNVQDTQKAASDALSMAEAASEVVNGHEKVSDKVKAQLEDALGDLREGVSLITRDGGVNSDAMRAAEGAISQYLGAMTAVGNNLPRDNAVLGPLLKSYRSAQAAQRSLVRTIESSTNAAENLPHAKAIWQLRDRIDTATNALASSVKALPAARAVTPEIVAGAGLSVIILSILSFVLIFKTFASRERFVETRGNSIQGTQRERSKELNLLLMELNKVGKGDLSLTITEDKESTKEIARELNSVFGNLKTILDEANGTIMGLAAASEETLLTAKNVDRNRQEQFRAIEHIRDLISNMLSYIGVIEQMTSATQRVSQEVADQVRNGSDSVNDVHEGIILLNQHNTGIQHQSKNLIESFQHLERIATVVQAVATKADYVAWNGYLVADNIGDAEVARRMTKSAEAMESLARESHTAVAEISQLLKAMNDAARDTQLVVDNSQREIESLLKRSNVAQNSLSSISAMTSRLHQSVDEVTSRTVNLKEQSAEVAETMSSIHHYATENSAASEQTASAISNVNRQAQELQRVIAHYTRAD